MRPAFYTLAAICLGFGILLAVAGCGAMDARLARDPLGRASAIGMTVPDLLDVMGKPDAVLQTGPDTAILQYERKDSAAGLLLTVSMLGTIAIGAGGGCKAVFTILRAGTVADVTFPGSYSDGLIALPYSACSPLVSEMISHRENNAIPLGYDAFRYLFTDKPRP
jgi:hypothetical protein